jgi:hypothetical protein
MFSKFLNSDLKFLTGLYCSIESPSAKIYLSTINLENGVYETYEAKKFPKGLSEPQSKPFGRAPRSYSLTQILHNVHCTVCVAIYTSFFRFRLV